MNTETIKSEFQFIGNSIEALNIHNDFIMLPDDGLTKQIDVSYAIKNISKDKDGIWGIVNLYVDCSLVSDKKDESDEQGEFKIGLILNGCFTDKKDISNEEFEKMLKINGCAAMYSIARSIIIGISSQSVVDGSIILPMINVFKLHEN